MSTFYESMYLDALCDAMEIDDLFRSLSVSRDEHIQDFDRQLKLLKLKTDTILKQQVNAMRDGMEAEKISSTCPEFPDIMKGIARDFAVLYSSHLEAPPHFFYMSFLTCLGSVLSNKISLASEIKPQPRLYTILLGESADVRKSTAIMKTLIFFKEAMGDTFNEALGVGSAEGLQILLKKNKSLILVFDEFKQFVSKCKIESSVLLPCVTTLFESNSYENMTSKTHLKLSDAYLVILAASTTDTYERCWDSSFTDIGFNNRLFLVPGCGERKFGIPLKIPSGEKALIKSKLAELMDWVGGHREFSITPDAMAYYEGWYMGLPNSIHAKRLDAYAMRFMSLMAANEMKESIDIGIVKDVIELMNWQLEVRRHYDPIDSDSKIGKIEEKIRRYLKSGPKTIRQLYRYIHVERTGIWPFKSALGNLVSSHEVAENEGEYSLLETE